MKCPEKERLQQQCTAAWDLYVTEIAAAGISVDIRSGAPMPPTISLWKAQSLNVGRQSGILAAAYRMAIRLRGKHLARTLRPNALLKLASNISSESNPFALSCAAGPSLPCRSPIERSAISNSG